MDEFLDQTCIILSVTSKDSQGNPILNRLGKPIQNEKIVATLECRVDETRYRSRDSSVGEPGVATETDFRTLIYTQWTEEKITPDMRIRIVNTGEYYNIVSGNRVRDLSGLGHHYEIEVRRSFNV